MTALTTQNLVDAFTAKLTEHLDASKLDGPVRVDPTRTIVIIPVKGKGPIHAHIQHQVDERGVQNVINQIKVVPSLKGLLKEG